MTDRCWWLVLVITAAGAVLRAVGLDGQLWYDEITTLVNTVRVPLATMVSSYDSNNQHTLYSILAQGSVAVLGERPWTLRLPAMLMGTASIPALYLLGRTMVGKFEAVAAAALLAVSYHHVWFSQNARGYTGLMLATLLATWCFVEGLRAPTWRHWGVYSVVVALGAYMHLTMAFVPVAHTIVLVGLAVQAAWQRRSVAFLAKPSAAIVLSGLLTLACYSPMAPDLVAHFEKQQGNFVRSEWTSLTWAVTTALDGLEIGFGSIALAAAALIGAAGCWRWLRSNPMAVALVVLPGLIGLGVMVAMQRNIWPRFFFFVFGLALLGLVAGISALGDWFGGMAPPSRRSALRRWFAGGLVALLLVQSVRSLGPVYTCPKQDFAGALAFVEGAHQAGEPVVTVGLTTFPYQHYYNRPWVAVEDEAELNQVLKAGRRTWLLYTFPIHLRAYCPGVARHVFDEHVFKPVKTFPATVGDGEVHVMVAGGARPPERARAPGRHGASSGRSIRSI